MGGTLSLSMVLLCSYLQNPTAFIYLYSISFGIGKAFMYSAALQAGWSHLQGRIGMVSGLIICGFGFGGWCAAEGRSEAQAGDAAPGSFEI